MGNDAVLMGPAVTAGTEESSAIWENPAGLAATRRSKLNVGLSAFALQIIAVDDILRFKVAGQTYTDDVDRVEFLSVPASVAYGLNLTEGLNLGFGIFVPELSSSYMRTSVPIRATLTTDENGEPYAVDANGQPVPIDVIADSHIELSSTHARTVAGPSLGWQALAWLRVGISIFGEYLTTKVRWSLANELSFAATDGSGISRAGETAKSEVSVSSIACHAALGIQVNPLPPLRIGITLRSPSLLVYQWVDNVGFTSAFSIDAGGAGSFDIKPDDLSANYPGGGGLVRPLRVHVGIAWKEPEWWIGTDFDYTMGLDDPDAEAVLEPVWNLAVGARGAIAKDLSIGGGFFTDHSPEPPIQNLGDAVVDYYGFTIGFETRTPLSLRKDPSPDALIFTSTFGIRYAVGIGKVGGLDVDLNPHVVEIPVVFHELQLNLGSALYF
jgi:hypothetical protein